MLYIILSAASCERRSRSPNNAVISNLPAGGKPPLPPNRRWMSDVLTPKVPRPCRRLPSRRPPHRPGCVYSVRRHFSAPAHSTRRGQMDCGGSAGH